MTAQEAPSCHIMDSRRGPLHMPELRSRIGIPGLGLLWVFGFWGGGGWGSASIKAYRG